LGPEGIHVAHLIIDAGVDTEWVRNLKAQAGQTVQDGDLMDPASVAETYWQLYHQPKDAWTFEMDIRPFKEKF
jgi:NADP-dependent 3-hydroxy acid dehydrogenase YdfG